MGNAFGDGNLGWRKDDVGVDVDEKVKVSNADTTAGVLNDKLTVGEDTNSTDIIEKEIQNAGGDENLKIKIDPAKILEYIGNIQTEPTGFVNRTDSTISWSDAAPDRTFTITPTGVSYDFYVEGEKFTKSGSIVKQIANTEGIHFIYFDASGNIQETDTFTDAIILEYAFIAVIYWDVTNSTAIYFADERHGHKMSGTTHLYLHETRGTAWQEGLALTDVTADGASGSDLSAQFGTEIGIIWDEDIEFNISADARPAQLPVFYKVGAVPVWRKYTAINFPVRQFGGIGANRLSYNQFTGGAWQETQISGNNNFVLCHVFATNDENNKIIAIQGENEYTTITAARTGANTELNSLFIGGMPFAEFKALATVIYQTNSGYANSIKARVRSTDTGDDYIDWRQTSIGRGGASVTDSDELVKCSSNDTTAGFLEDKIVVSDGVNAADILEKSTLNDGGDEDVQIQIDETKIDHTNIQNVGVNTHAQLDIGLTNSVNHIADLANPHSVTKAQVGLGNVTNDAQVKKIGASTDNAIARWDLATGDLLQNSLSTLSDAGTLNIPAGETYNINGVSAVKQAFLVASSDSTAEAQRLAGTVINIAADSGAALETLFLTYNSIHLLSGTYNFTTNFDMVAGKALFGSGYFTILTKANAAVTNLIEATTNCTVSNLRLEGVSASYGSGNGIDGNSATDCWFQNIWVNDFGDSGIVNCFGLEQITSENNGEQGLDNCFNMTNINARNNGLNGFNASGRMSSTFSGGNTNDGYEDCVDMSSFYSLGNGRHGLNDCLRVTGGLISGHSGAGDVGVLNSEWVSSTLATGNTINYSGSNFLSSCDGVNSVADDYSNCDYLSSCRSFNAGDDAFYLCDSCVAIYANGANDDGIFQCTRVGFSLSQNSGDDGFNDSFHMGFNESNTNTGSDFVSCNANGGDSIAVADTATGGYNDS